MSLSPKQQRFVQEYLKDLNATQAYIRAGYTAKSAESNSSRLMSNDRVAAAIAEANGRLMDKLEITNENVLREMARLAFSDLAHYVKISTTGLRMVPFGELTPDQTAAMREVKVTRHYGKNGELTTETEFKLHAKDPSLDKLARHLGLYDADVSQRPVVPFYQVILPHGYEPPDKAEPIEAAAVPDTPIQSDGTPTPLPALPDDV